MTTNATESNACSSGSGATVILKGSSSNVTLIRNKPKVSTEQTEEQPKIVGKHKNYFECDECKNGFSMCLNGFELVDMRALIDLSSFRSSTRFGPTH